VILVTVGGQLPFDRLIRTVDQWAARVGRDDLFAQIGRGTYQPDSFVWGRFLNPLDFRKRASEASCIVAHAGMGSIITALELGKPIIVLPRRASMLEHRNDHQLASARRFIGRPGVHVAMDDAELTVALERLNGPRAAASAPDVLDAPGPTDELEGATLVETELLEPVASNQLLDALQRFVSPHSDSKNG
jgi:UDP-N-acetylglucosamine transferase subunit ALG13